MRKELLKWNAVPLLPAGDSQTQLMGTRQVRKISDLSGRRIRAEYPSARAGPSGLLLDPVPPLSLSSPLSVNHK